VLVKSPVHADEVTPYHSGFIYDQFPLTLVDGWRTEILGPLYYTQKVDTRSDWAFPLLALAGGEDPATESSDFDFIYPVFSYHRYGNEFRWQLFQLLDFAGSRYQDDNRAKRFTLFPIYFQQRSSRTNENYTAIVPFYGHLDHRLFKDKIDFVMFPFYAKTQKKDVITYNTPYPFFHTRYGDHLHGWQLWPFYGEEHKDPVTRTNEYGDEKLMGGHDTRFFVFPLFFQGTNLTGTPEQSHYEAFIPFYNYLRSPERDVTSYGWPLGVTHTVDREKKFVEWDAPWPLVEFAHGEGKTEHRIWPFFSEAHNTNLTANWYAWPVYKYNRVQSDPLDRSRTRILFFLYSDTKTRDTERKKEFRRKDFFGLYTWRKEMNGNEHLQVISILEPIFPNNTHMERTYSQLYALWRSDKNPTTQSASQSLLWNLYRHQTSPGTKKTSLLFGLFQYESTPAGKEWRVAYIPFHGSKPACSDPVRPAISK